MDDRRQITGRAVTAAPQRGANDHAPNNGEDECWSFEGFVVDVPGHVLRDASGRDVPLRRSEFALLLAFLRAPGRALSRDYLLDAVAGRRAESFDRSIDVLVGRLRRHIEPDPKAPRLIVTVPGIGYKFVARPRAAPAAAESEPPPIPPPVAVRAAERRLLTIMRCGIFGAGSIAAALDPEDWRDAVANFRGCCAEIIGRFGGVMLPSADHSVVAWFGYPGANELDAERAIHAGLALIAAMPTLSLGSAGALHAHIGIASGLVLISDADGSAGHAALGEAPNLAGALQSLAPVDTVLIGARTRELVGELFELRARGRVVAAGFAGPVQTWEVVGRGSAEGRFAALHGRNLSPLVGREEELFLLLRRWEQAKQGSGRVVLISAEPGLGKSRLAQELAERIAGERHVRLRYFCSPHHQDSAFYPVIAQMERAAGFARDDSLETKLTKLRTLLTDGTAFEDLALTADLLALPSGDIGPPPDVTPQEKREKTFEALLRQAERLSVRQPMLMIFEDLHWADPSSRKLLDRIVEGVANWPALLIATFRPEFQPPWAGQPHVTMLTLARLDRQDTAAMVRNIAGNTALAAATVEEIAESADGVPLFVEELTDAVIESRVQLASAGSSTRHAISSVPATLHGTLTARLDRLGTAARDVAQKAAAIGREFNYRVLAGIGDFPEPVLRDSLEKLISSGLLLTRGTPPQSTYKFKHALLQDAAYGTLPRGRRQQLHARIAATLEAQFEDSAEAAPEVLAHHLTEAGLPERAAGYWLQAGRQMLSRSGPAEAEVLLRKALSVITNLPDSLSRREHELELQVALGQALILTLGYSAPAVGRTYARAEQLCHDLDRRDRLVPILYGQIVHHSVRGDMRQAGALAARLRELADTQDDAVTRVIACRTSGFTALFSGEFVEGDRHVEQGLAVYRPSDQSALAKLSAQDSLVSLLCFSSQALACCGYLDRARSRISAALVEARRLSHAHSLAHALAMACQVGWLARSEPDELIEYAEELLAVSAARGFAIWRAFALARRGWCLVARGEIAQGLASLTDGLAENYTAGTKFQISAVLVLLADTHRMAGQLDLALRYLGESAQHAEQTHVEWLQSEALRMRGDLFLLGGDVAGAESSYRDALQLARRQGGKLFELRASTSLARLWRDQGKIAEARDLLAPIYNWFTEGFDAPDLIDAKALLGELAG